MTAREKFTINKRVVVNASAPRHHGKLGTIVGFCREPSSVRIKLEGIKKLGIWSINFLDVAGDNQLSTEVSVTPSASAAQKNS